MAEGGSSDSLGQQQAQAPRAVSAVPVMVNPGPPPSIEALLSAAGPSLGDGASRHSSGKRPSPVALGRPQEKSLQEQAGEYAQVVAMPPQRTDVPSTPELRLVDFLAFLQGLCVSPKHLLRWIWETLWRPFAGLIWFCSLLAPQIAFGLLMSTLAVIFSQRVDGPLGSDNKYIREYKDTHKVFGAILGFVIALRTNHAYNQKSEGRRELGKLAEALREIVLEAYSSLPKGYAAHANEDTLTEEERCLATTAREIRRLCNLAFAFIRQDLRESRFGFLTGTQLEEEKTSFDSKTFVLDPVRPRLWDLLSAEELKLYRPLSTRARAGVCVGLMKQQVELMALHLQKGKDFINIMAQLTQTVLALHASMCRIRDSPMPYPVIYVLQASCFIFVYSTPWLYLTGTVGTFICVQCLILIYWGLLSVSSTVENPYKYARGGFSLPLENYCRRLHDLTLEYAQALGGDDTSYVPPYLDGECAAVVVLEKGA